MSKPPIRILIADDEQLLRQGVRALLGTSKDIEIVAEARDGAEAVDLVEKLSPDVVLMDLAMPRLDGLGAVERIRALRKNTRILILTMYIDETTIDDAISHGVYGYLLKTCTRAELVNAIHSAYERRPYFGPSTLPYVSKRGPRLN